MYHLYFLHLFHKQTASSNSHGRVKAFIVRDKYGFKPRQNLVKIKEGITVARKGAGAPDGNLRGGAGHAAALAQDNPSYLAPQGIGYVRLVGLRQGPAFHLLHGVGEDF